MSHTFDGTSQLNRAAELRDTPFTKRPDRAPRRRGPATTIVNPNGIIGKAIIDGQHAACSFKGRTTATLEIAWVDPA